MSHPGHPTPVPAPVPQAVRAHPHPEPRPYALMLRTWSWEPWRPIVGILILVVGFFAMPFVLIPVLLAGAALDHERSFTDAVSRAATFEDVTWYGMLYLNLSLAAIILVTWALVRYLHRMRPRWLASVRPGFRWGFFGVCFGLALVALVAQIVVGLFLPVDEGDLSGGLNPVTGQMVAIGIVVLLTTPFQAIGEEYGFRGYAMQAFGSLTRRPWVAIVLSAVLFALAHGVQNAPLFLDRFVFGLMAGYVVHRTGGLEAGIAMHIWNNLLAFGFALAIGDIGESLTVSEVSWWNIPLTLTQNGVYLVLVLVVARAMGLRDHTAPPAAAVVLEPANRPV